MKLQRTLLSAGATLAALLISAQTALAASAALEMAKSLAESKNYAAALQRIDAQTVSERNSYESRFLKARVLAWSGAYTASRSEYRALLNDFSGNADVQVAAGYLEYYDGEYEVAEGYFTDVLSRYPNYNDARTGLEKTRKARNAAKGVKPYQWRIDTGSGVSSFDVSALDNWNNQYVRVEHVPGDYAYHGAVNRYDRFGLTDTQIDVGIASGRRGDWDWGVSGGFTPDADFRPETHLGGRVGRVYDAGDGLKIRTGLAYRMDDYDAGLIHNISPEVNGYFESGLVLTGRLIGVIQEAADNQIGGLVNAKIPVSDRLSLLAGGAMAPEAVNGVAITTNSLFGGLTYSVTDSLDVQINLTHDDREDTYVRDALNVGLTYKH